MILDILYAIFIQPIEWGMGWAFAESYSLVYSYGLAILLLSLIVNFALIPIYLLSDKWMVEERIIQEKMNAKLREIKQAFVGQERFMMTRMLYKINNYHPLMAVRNSFGLLIQIPFFFAAYQLISNYDALVNVSFFIFDDLSKPDRLLSIGNWNINLMPFVMTGINLASAYVYSSSLSKKDQIQVYVIAGIFLVALYFMPVALVLYWTINNIFSLVKNLIYKKFPKITSFKLGDKKVSSKYAGLFKETLLIFAAMISAFMLVPLFMIGNNPEDFYFIDAKVFYDTAILFSLLGTLVLGFVNFIFRFLGLIKISIFYIYFGLSFIVLSGFLFPVSASAILIEPENNPVNYLNLSLVVFTSILIAYACLDKLRHYIQVFLLVVVFISTGSALLSISKHENLMSKDYSNEILYSQKKSALESNKSLQLSNKKNIFIISFDGIPGDIVNGLVKNSLEFTSTLKDFIIFENAVNHAPSTKTSLLGDIYGIQDYKSLGDSRSTLRSNLLKHELFLNTTANKIDDSYQYDYAKLGINRMYFSTPFSETFNFFRYPIIRLGTSYTLKILNWGRFKRFEQYVGSQESELSVLLEEIQEDGIHKWTKGVIDFHNYNLFVSSASAVNKDISLRNLHFSFTHTPVLFDEKCIYKGNDKDWFDINQNEQGLIKQTECGLVKFSVFLERLKQLGIYDKSLIVFKSEHGQEAGFFSEYPNNLYMNGNLRWGYNRYRSFLMIKDFSAVNKKPVYKSDLVLQNDIAKTVCLNSEVPADCNVFNGVNLLADSLKTDEPYYLYVPQNQDEGFWLFENLISVKIPSRSTSLLQAMQNSELIKLSNSDENKK